MEKNKSTSWSVFVWKVNYLMLISGLLNCCIIAVSLLLCSNRNSTEHQPSAELHFHHSVLWHFRLAHWAVALSGCSISIQRNSSLKVVTHCHKCFFFYFTAGLCPRFIFFGPSLHWFPADVYISVTALHFQGVGHVLNHEEKLPYIKRAYPGVTSVLVGKPGSLWQDVFIVALSMSNSRATSM